MVGKETFGEEATRAMPAPLDLRSREDHSSHLQHEADRELKFILCPGCYTGQEVSKARGLLGQQPRSWDSLEYVVGPLGEGARRVLGSFEPQGQLLLLSVG